MFGWCVVYWHLGLVGGGGGVAARQSTATSAEGVSRVSDGSYYLLKCSTEQWKGYFFVIFR